MINRERMVENFINMAKISSPSLKEREVADYIKKELESIGLEVIEDNAGEKTGGNSGNTRNQDESNIKSSWKEKGFIKCTYGYSLTL